MIGYQRGDMCQFATMFTRSLKSIATFSLLAFVSGCATSHFGPLPQSDDDFRKPPGELRAAFAGVRATPAEGQSGIRAPKLSDLEAQWGTSQNIIIDLPHHIQRRAPFSVLSLSLIGPTGLGAGIAAIPWFFSPNDYVHTYDKGNYRVRVYTMSAFGGTDEVISWDWTHHSASGDAELFPVELLHADDAQPRVRFIGRLGAMFGSGWVRNKFDSRHPKLEGGIDLAYGAEFSVIPADVLNIALLLGYRTPDAVNANSELGLNIREFPLQITVEHRILPDFKIGAGFAKHFNAQLSSNYSSDMSLGAPIGFLLNGEYKLNPHIGVGIKAEHLNYKINNEPSINGNSITLTLNFN